MKLPGLERLEGVCQQLGLEWLTRPASRAAPAAGTPVSGLPFDAVLAAFYARMSKASFATDVAGLVMAGNDESAFTLEKANAGWQEEAQARLALPLFIFGGAAGMAYHYATVPSLADALGRQPVVEVDTYEVPYALPIASNVDRFFDTYSHYLEALSALPGFREDGEAALAFPWEVPHIIGRDEQLVELIRSGAFTPLMKKTDETLQWVERVTAASRRA
ncbi:hypothetical protein [Hyalangium gracile]|uniref:hypothetical protein n=1 Tax=Hyalangium gracile TaxID=394092 RepID=UPI001CCC7569|nr:hypothetical protein [Hyalangium gracile]